MYKKPTIKEMKQRPSLWISDVNIIHIKYPDGRTEKFYEMLSEGEWDFTFITFDYDFYFNRCEFLGWL